ncbi:helix-turn-helix domain-containing protein [Rheinheimera soli]|uniref:AraC-like DNA-binding protein n=1 Tax=Rheinheimera soli TaxID=443616 RepID=A0ABU1W077_9GAMM|nr:helix-turn-helix domain-containing protein [Rheinheimera soli]MDR7121073.1 AraC-like DNA-binding protein [Rheinheimera soli]
MKSNHNKISGVLHQRQSAERYQLRRYFPDAALAELIEQFWLVDWDLRGQAAHVQQNLPDPNFHLFVSNGKVTMLGPVSKSYSYEMQGKGQIIGVKFVLGALAEKLNFKPADFIDRQVDVQQMFNLDTSRLLSELSAANSDPQIVAILHSCFQPFAIQPSLQRTRVRQLVDMIKQQSDITRVELLSERSEIPIRAIQRCFRQYLGINPKWLIRKYRLHQALELLEQQSVEIADLVEALGYTDQSHLIRDFKEFLGVTPTAYKLHP